MDLVVDLGASHHVIADLADLVIHESYTAFDSVIIGDGTCLFIANIDSFTIPSLPTPLLFTNVLHVPAMSKNLINVMFFYSFLSSARLSLEGHSGSWEA